MSIGPDIHRCDISEKVYSIHYQLSHIERVPFQLIRPRLRVNVGGGGEQGTETPLVLVAADSFSLLLVYIAPSC